MNHFAAGPHKYEAAYRILLVSVTNCAAWNPKQSRNCTMNMSALPFVPSNSSGGCTFIGWDTITSGATDGAGVMTTSSWMLAVERRVLELDGTMLLCHCAR